MTNHHLAQVLAYVLFDVAQQHKDLQSYRDELAKAPWFSVYAAWDLLRKKESSNVHRINLRQFLQAHPADFLLLNDFSTLWLSICDPDGILSLASFSSWFPSLNTPTNHPYNLSRNEPKKLATSLARLFNHHAQCCLNVKRTARQRISNLDLNTFLLVDMNGDGVISRDDIELFMSAHNVNVAQAPFDVAGNLLKFFRVSPYRGTVNLREWARVFHASAKSFRYVGTPTRASRGSMTPSSVHRASFQRPSYSTPLTHRLSRAGTWAPGSSERIPKQPSLTPSRRSTRASKISKIEDLQIEPFELPIESNSNETNNSGKTQANQTKSNDSGRTTNSDRTDYGILGNSKSRSRNFFTPFTEKVSRSNSMYSNRSRLHRQSTESANIDFHRAQLSYLEKKDKFTSSLLIQKRRNARKHAVSKANYSVLHTSSKGFQSQKMKVFTVPGEESHSTPTFNQVGEKLLRLSDLESSPLDFSEEEKNHYSSAESEAQLNMGDFMELEFG